MTLLSWEFMAATAACFIIPGIAVIVYAFIRFPVR